MRRLILVLLLALAARSAAAGPADSLSRPKVKFIYDVDFEYVFDNAEYDHSKGYYEASSTMHMLQFRPGLGLRVDQGDGKFRHTLYGSLIVDHDFGVPGFNILQLFDEANLFYRVDAKLGPGEFSGIAGWFPREFMEGEYIGAFFSTRNVVEDSSLEGLFFKYRMPNLYAELGLDWLGIKSGTSRERFRILSAGEYKFPYGISAGWAAQFYHFACSETANNVVDNHMLHLYGKWSPSTPLQQLDVTLGAIATYQWDRAVRESRTFPFGFQSDQTARMWNAGIHNSFYYGQDLMPFYGVSDYGAPYARDLYFGEIFYHTHINGFSFYDRIEAFYEPRIFPWLDLKVAIVCHLGNPTRYYSAFRGWQQILALRFNLDKLLRK